MGDSDLVGGFLMVALTLVLGFPLVSNSCRSSRLLRPWMARLLAWRFVVFLFLVLWMLPFYSESADALRYHYEGKGVAAAIRAGAWQDVPWATGTVGFSVWTGFLYTPVGGNASALFFLSMFVGLAAAICLYKAFALFGSREGARVYGILILFLPSYAMWTSIHGKDSWVGFGLGLIAYGYALWLRGHASKGITYFALGCIPTLWFRPHIALVVLIALLASQLMCHGRGSSTSASAKVLRIAVLIPIVYFAAQVATSSLGWSSIDQETMLAERNTGAQGNAYGGSAIEVQRTATGRELLLSLPQGIVNVLFRPFPWEAHNFNAALAAAENVFLLAFFLYRFRSLGGVIRNLPNQPYFMFSAVLAIELLVAFSNISNLGLMSRERVQMLPFLFVPLAGVHEQNGNVSAKRRRLRRVRSVHNNLDPVPSHS